MIIGSVELKIHVPFVHSLKEKRMIIKSLIKRIQNRFNVSISEVGENDNHRIIVLGFVTVSTSTKHVNSVIDTVLNFIEQNTEGEIIEVVREML